MRWVSGSKVTVQQKKILCASPTPVILLLQFYERDELKAEPVMNFQGCKFERGQ